MSNTNVAYQQKGASLLEVIVAMVLFSLVAVFLFYLVLDTTKTNSKVLNDNQAQQLAEQGYEAVRSLRDRNWDLITSDGVYGLARDPSGYWILTPTPDTNGIFTRQLTIDSVYRNHIGDIVVTGTPDPDTKKITTRISWQEDNRIQQLSLEQFLTNWRVNSLLTNGSFENWSGAAPLVDFSGWVETSVDSFSFTADSGRNGSGSGATITRVAGLDPLFNFSQTTIPIEGAHAYTLSLWSKGTIAASDIPLRIIDEDGYWLDQSGAWVLSPGTTAGYVAHQSSTPEVWVEKSLYFTTRSFATELAVEVHCTTAAVGTYFTLDHVKLLPE